MSSRMTSLETMRLNRHFSEWLDSMAKRYGNYVRVYEGLLYEAFIEGIGGCIRVHSDMPDDGGQSRSVSTSPGNAATDSDITRSNQNHDVTLRVRHLCEL